MLPQEFLVHPRLVIIAVKVSFSDELYEVFPAGFVFTKKNQVVPLVVNFRPLVLVAVRGDVGFHAQNRLDARFFGLFVKLNRSVKSAVVGQGEGVHSQLFGAGNELVYLRQAVQKGEVGMNVKVGEFHNKELIFLQ